MTLGSRKEESKGSVFCAYLVPGLVELEQLTETESYTITLLVAVAQGISCPRGNQYLIHVDIRNQSSSLVSTRVISFSTQVVSHVSISAGTYECTSRVMNGGNMVDSTSIFCQSTGKYGLHQNYVCTRVMQPNLYHSKYGKSSGHL